MFDILSSFAKRRLCILSKHYRDENILEPQEY
jgi:hypothetical protein